MGLKADPDDTMEEENMSLLLNSITQHTQGYSPDLQNITADLLHG